MEGGQPFKYGLQVLDVDYKWRFFDLRGSWPLGRLACQENSSPGGALERLMADSIEVEGKLKGAKDHRETGIQKGIGRPENGQGMGPSWSVEATANESCAAYQIHGQKTATY